MLYNPPFFEPRYPNDRGFLESLKRARDLDRAIRLLLKIFFSLLLIRKKQRVWKKIPKFSLFYTQKMYQVF